MHHHGAEFRADGAPKVLAHALDVRQEIEHNDGVRRHACHACVSVRVCVNGLIV